MILSIGRSARAAAAVAAAAALGDNCFAIFVEIERRCAALGLQIGEQRLRASQRVRCQQRTTTTTTTTTTIRRRPHNNDTDHDKADNDNNTTSCFSCIFMRCSTRLPLKRTSSVLAMRASSSAARAAVAARPPWIGRHRHRRRRRPMHH